MGKVSLIHGKFITSALKPSEIPPPNYPEFAIVGRSNVGKSSLINHLMQTKNLAKVSSNPGKTQRLNYFLIDQKFYLVDLPGYGYAKTSHSLKQEWGHWIKNYFETRKITLTLFLIDSRRLLSPKDQEFLYWLKEAQIPTVLIITKQDKLNQSEKAKLHHAVISNPNFLALTGEISPIFYSVKQTEGRNQLIATIHKHLFHKSPSL